ncbi:MAG: sigma-70 family RNA polymerase sigma factor [Oceanicaulis sp.]|nr:sigma-70 family RNA polymerase sigma factor [Oceanicaulis sp.]
MTDPLPAHGAARSPVSPAPAGSRAHIDGDPRDAIIGHLPALRTFALSLCRDASQADDLLQDTVVKAWSKFHLFTEGTNLRAWLFTILRNNFYSGRRKKARETEDPDEIMAGQLVSKPDQYGHLALGELQAALKRIPDEQREALILVGAMGFTVEEAAETCGCAPGTIKSRTNRARKALAALLGLDGHESNLASDISEAILSAEPDPSA